MKTTSLLRSFTGSLGFQSHHILSHDCRLHIGISRGCAEVQILLFLDFLQHLDSFSVYLL